MNAIDEPHDVVESTRLGNCLQREHHLLTSDILSFESGDAPDLLS